ncbi:MAG: amino acid ABC transporter substrate-binding protein [Sneathiella sp.]|nr:amino acid ABC transporter substrate-binding protein [Sneathiella sp.]
MFYGDNTNVPFVYLDPSGKPSGIVIDLLNQIEKKIPYTFSYELLPWKRAYRSAESGNGAIIGVSKNSKRLKIFDYTDVLYYHDIVLVVLKGNEFVFNKIEDLKGKRVAVPRGSKYSDDYVKALSDGLFEAVKTDSREQRLKLLLRGRIDVALIGGGKAGVKLSISQLPELIENRKRFVTLGTPLLRDANFIAFNKGLEATGFIQKYNQALKQSLKNGTYQQIMQSYE